MFLDYSVVAISVLKTHPKMKVIILAALFAFAVAAPSQRLLIPRMPPAVLVNNKYQLIPEDKIVGGKEVTPNSLPFQISLQRKGALGGFSQSCGGSIYNANTILNAAHCVDGATDLSIFRVVAGEHNLNTVSGLEQNRDVSAYKMHEKYSSSTQENDIAVIRVATPLDLSVPSAKAINMPTANSEPTGTLTVSGWGTTSSGGSISNVLLAVDVPFVTDSACNTAYAGPLNPNPIYPSMLCAGDIRNGGVDSCQGDSGGPLFSSSGENFVQHGVVSWGRGCASAGYPGVYTQVSYFIDWLKTNAY